MARQVVLILFFCIFLEPQNQVDAVVHKERSAALQETLSCARTDR